VVAPIITVFGATGFLGQRIVRRLHEQGCAVRIVSRRPGRARAMFSTDDPRLRPIDGDIRSGQSVADAIAGARGVVNAVSLYIEHGEETFHAVHVEGARRVAVEARRLGVEQFVHISGIGADAQSRSPYIRSRGQGELAVRTAYPGAILIRPAVMFAPDDAFLSVILKLLQRLPAYPIFGSGMTRLQPVHVDDVAEAVARIVQRTERDPITLECGGPQVYTYRDLVRTIAREASLKPRMIPVPFGVWYALARAAELLPSPAITRNQVELMQVDTVASPDLPGLRDLGIAPQQLEETVRLALQRRSASR
jgi:NADH dehydrogenase